MDKISSKVHRVHMELGGKLLNSLSVKTQFLERLQSVSVVDGAAHTQNDDVKSNRGSLENVAKVFMLFLCGVQLVLRSGVLTVLDLDEADVTPRFVEVFGSMLSGVGGTAGGWRCCWGASSRDASAHDNSVLRSFTSHGNMEMVKRLIRVYGAQGREEKALLNAAVQGHLRVVRLLMSEFGARPPSENGDDDDPLHYTTRIYTRVYIYERSELQGSSAASLPQSHRDDRSP